jgi:hypothetical protein
MLSPLKVWNNLFIFHNIILQELNKIIISVLLFTNVWIISCNAQEPKIVSNADLKEVLDTPIQVKLLIKYYDKVVGFKNNQLIFEDGSTLIYDDELKEKSITQLLNNPDIEDQFLYKYPIENFNNPISKNQDPGRIRNEEFFKKIYGTSAKEVRSNLVEVVWCPNLVNQKILVTKINGVAEKIKKISAELDKIPQYKKYIQKIGGTFIWRNIKGTNRLSMHSFGMTIDINTNYSNYWQWDCKCTDENKSLQHKNQIPKEIIEIFEKYGFIWGGKWYHYDTMHFEYRPELIDNSKV